MYFFVDACITGFAFVLYWCNRDRRKYLKKRVGRCSLRNVYQVARNASFMILRRKLTKSSGLEMLAHGAVLYSFHYGIWELVPAALAAQGFKLGVLVNKYADTSGLLGTRVDKMLFRFRAQPHINIFYKEDVFRMIRFAKAGGLVAMLVDGDELYSKFHNAKKISTLCRLPLVPFAAYRTRGEGILKIGCDLDQLVKQRPMDYMWFYRSRRERDVLAA
jgi:hypothetical protein